MKACRKIVQLVQKNRIFIVALYLQNITKIFERVLHSLITFARIDYREMAILCTNVSPIYMTN